jgi:hypothetical protein
MSKFNLLVFLNTNSDPFSSNNDPSLINFKWARDISNINTSSPSSESFSVDPGETRSVFSGIRTLSHDNTTVYNLTRKPLTSNTYILKAISGTMPNFRTARTIGIDATTQVTVTQNGPLMIFTSTGGTLFNLTSVQIGDNVRIGNVFNSLNRGEFKILSKTSTSFTVELSGVAEGSITLGGSFADQIQIYSAAGVQIDDTVKITGGFSPISQNSYKISGVAADFIEFYYTEALPEELGIQTDSFNIYSSAKQLIYLESDQKISVILNNMITNEIEPFVINNSKLPGVFLLKSTIFSLSISNNGIQPANIYFAAIE